MESTMQRQRRPPLPPTPRPSGGRGPLEWTAGDPPGAGGETLLLCWKERRRPEWGSEGKETRWEWGRMPSGWGGGRHSRMRTPSDGGTGFS